MRIAIYLVASLSVAGCGPRNYDDCILAGLKNVSFAPEARLLYNSCAAKFAPDFDWDKMAAKANIRPWSEAITYASYTTLKERQAIKSGYFDALAPQIRDEFHEIARHRFMSEND